MGILNDVKKRKLISVTMIIFAMVFMAVSTGFFEWSNIWKLFAAGNLNTVQSPLSYTGVYEFNDGAGDGLLQYSVITNDKTAISYYTSNATANENKQDLGTAQDEAYWAYLELNDGRNQISDKSIPLKKIDTWQSQESWDFTEISMGMVKTKALTATEETGEITYSVSFTATGTYRVYVYCADGTPDFSYYLIDSAAAEAAYTPQTVSKVENSDGWYYADIKIDRLSWDCVALLADSIQKYEHTSGSSVSHKGSTSYKPTVGSTDYHKYWNDWDSAVSRPSFATVLTFKFENCSLGPINRSDVSLTVGTNDATQGTVTATDAFGNTTISNYGKVIIDATPASNYVFVGLVDASGNNIGFDTLDYEGKTYYVYEFDGSDGSAIYADWDEMEAVAGITVKADGTKVSDLHFVTKKTGKTASNKETLVKYEFIVTPEAGATISSLTYSVDGGAEYFIDETALDVSNGGSFKFSLRWCDAVVTLKATTARTTYTVTYTITKSDIRNVYVAKNSNGQNFRYIEDALANTSSGTITILNNASFFPQDPEAEGYVPANPEWGYGTSNPVGYTLKSGVTLYLVGSIDPNKSENKAVEHEHAVRVPNSTEKTDMNPYGTGLEHTLTMPKNVDFNINGTFVIAGTLYGENSSSGTALGGGANGGQHCNLQIDDGAKLTVNSGGILSTYGFIVGNGNIDVKKGGYLYQPMVVIDYRGGGYTVGAGYQYVLGEYRGIGGILADAPGSDLSLSSSRLTGELNIMPFIRYAFAAIQTEIDMAYGSYMYAYAALYAGSDMNCTTPCIIGDGTSTKTGVINLNDGSSFNSKYYADKSVSSVPYIGKTEITITGSGVNTTTNAKSGFMGTLVLSLSIKNIIDVTVNTTIMTFPVPYNFDINLENGIYDIDYSMALLPGATLRVGEDAVLDIGNGTNAMKFVVYDGFYDHTYGGKSSAVDRNHGSTSNPYPLTQTLISSGYSPMANFIVNGKLVINSGVSFGGYIQSEVDGAKIDVKSGAILSDVKTQCGIVSGYDISIAIYSYGPYYFAGATVRSLDAWVFDAVTGQRVALEAGNVYTSIKGASIISSYEYNLYYSSAAPTTYKTYQESLGELAHGKWYTGELDTSAIVAGIIDPNNANACRATFPSLSAAIAAAQNGETVVLLADYTMNDVIYIEKDKTVTINLNGYVLTCNSMFLHNEGNVTFIANTPYTNATPGEKSAIVFADQSGNIFSTKFIENKVGAVANITLSEGTSFTSKGIISAIVNAGTMTLDINGATISHTDAYSYNVTGTTEESITSQSKQAIYNTGTLTLKDSAATKGKITSSASTTSSTLANYVKTIANLDGATLTLDGITIEQTQATNAYATVIYNYKSSVITGISDSIITAKNTKKWYAIENYGSQIGEITGSTITGYYGIRNRNIRAGTQASADGYSVANIANIGLIKDVNITVKTYGIYNAAKIGTIDGTTSTDADNNIVNNSTIKATTSIAIYNASAWYYDTPIQRIDRETITGGESFDTVGGETLDFAAGDTAIRDTRIYDTKNVPTIEKITGGVTLEAPYNTLYNVSADILEISGNVVITGTTCTSSSQHAVYNNTGGYIGVIKDNVLIQMTNASPYDSAAALYNAATPRIHKVVRVYADSVADKNLRIEKTYYYGTNEEGAKTVLLSTIGSIEGNVQITSAKSYAVNNGGLINQITGDVTMNAKNYALNNAAYYTLSKDILRSDLGTTSVISDKTQYHTLDEIEYTYGTPRIEKITGNVKITTSSTYALRNYAQIDEISGGVQISATQYGIFNDSNATRYGTRKTFIYYYDTSKNSTSNKSFSETSAEFTYSDAISTIDKIDGITVTATGSKGMALYNTGYIGTITNSTIQSTNSKGPSAIVQKAGISEREYIVTDDYKTAYTLDYTVAEDGTATGTGKYTNSGGFANNLTDNYVYALGTIDLIGGGNTITSKYPTTVNNMGIINAINDTIPGTTETKSTTFSGTDKVIYNYDGSYVNRLVTKVDGEETTTYPGSVYASAWIGKISGAVTITGTKGDAIHNTATSAEYTDVTIGEIGGGVTVKTSSTSTAGIAINNINAKIGKISDNVTITAAKGDAIHNTSASADYPDAIIGEIGSGVTVQATSGNAIQNDNAVISKISGGTFISKSKGYTTVYISSGGSIEDISGGRFKSTAANGTTSTSNTLKTDGNENNKLSISGGEFVNSNYKEHYLDDGILACIIPGKVISKTTNANGYYYITDCYGHDFNLNSDCKSTSCSVCGGQSGTITLDGNATFALNATLDALGKDESYFVVINNGTYKLLVEETEYANGVLTFTVDTFYAGLENIEDDANITIHKDVWGDNLLKLRGYQTSGMKLRLYSTILQSKCNLAENGTTIQDYDRFELTMKVTTSDGAEYTGATIKQRTVYEYLHKGTDSVFAFEDTYVFSVGTDLSYFKDIATDGKLTLTLTETVYYTDGTSKPYDYTFSVTLGTDSITVTGLETSPETDYSTPNSDINA